MSFYRWKALAWAAAVSLAVSHAQAGTIFSHDFENAPNPGTAVTSVADLGAPAAGSFSFSGSPVGGIGGARPSLAVGNNTNGIANMTQMAVNSVPFAGTVPETVIADAGGGDLVFADFATPGAFTGGANTEISFTMASFGNSNTGTFKYQFIRGLDDAGAEVFELLLVSGSGATTRQVYARGADDDSTEITAVNGAGAPNAGTPEGVLLADNFQFNLNGTNVANGRPTGVYTMNILLEDGMVTYDIGATGGTLNPTAANSMAMPINSAATTISRLEFSSVWSELVDGQNKGYWLDDINVATIPEPAGAVLGLMAALGLFGRRRA